MDSVLALSAGFVPVARVSWQKAMLHILDSTAEVVEVYPDKLIRSARQSWAAPSVIRFVKDVRRSRKVPKFSRENVFARDHGKCCYCGKRVERDDFSYDHVIPRRLNGPTTWENIATCCTSCNQRKGGRLLHEAGMRLLQAPYKPTAAQLPRELLFHLRWHPSMPESWKAFLTSGSYWRGGLEQS